MMVSGHIETPAVLPLGRNPDVSRRLGGLKSRYGCGLGKKNLASAGNLNTDLPPLSLRYPEQSLQLHNMFAVIALIVQGPYFI
jgi:hypothetical protein